MMRRPRRIRRRAVAVGMVSVFTLVIAGVGAGNASAFNEAYGGVSICGSNCFVQSGAAHTFVFNEGSTASGAGALACQLFNSKGANEVSHGTGFCNVFYGGGEFVWARVYNQSGVSRTVSGFAET